MLGLNTMTNMLRQAPKLTRGLSTSAVRNDVSRMILVGRLANTPDVRQTANGNEYAVYTVATRDPSRPSSDPQNATSSYHRVFAFGDNVNRVRRLLKGSPVYVEADFRVERVQVAEDKLSEKIFTNHRYIQLLRNMQMVNTGASQNRRNDGESAAPADSYEDVHGEGEESQSSRSY